MHKQICRKLTKITKRPLLPDQRLTFSSENGKLLVHTVIRGYLPDKEDEIHIPYEFTDEEAEELYDFMVNIMNDKEECK